MAFSADQLLEKVNTYLATMPYVREPKGLYAPIEYVLSLGGKRIRPVLMLLSYQLYKENVDDILPQAAGIETYHNYTLLHDDLMDRADMRRNKPTVHKVWDGLCTNRVVGPIHAPMPCALTARFVACA
jgi:geranylgeranyl diphosphate synthase type II